MKLRTVGAIAMYPTGNDEGAVSYMSLYSGRELNRNQANQLSMTADVIDRIHALATTRLDVVSTQALVLSWIIDAREGQDVATADITDASLQTEYTKGIHTYESKARCSN